MIRTEKRLRLCIALLSVNLIFIWGNSLLPGSVSGALSQWLKDMLSGLFGGAGSSVSGDGLLRKLAHFTEFCTLGMCLRWLFGMLRQRTWEHMVYPLAAGVLAASVDETIQLFVPDRGPGILDVLIDSSGAILGIILLSSLHYLKTKQLEKTR